MSEYKHEAVAIDAAGNELSCERYTFEVDASGRVPTVRLLRLEKLNRLVHPRTTTVIWDGLWQAQPDWAADIAREWARTSEGREAIERAVAADQEIAEHQREVDRENRSIAAQHRRLAV